MSQEIVFTSARHGLRTGSTGFCTVRSTRGMPGNLAQLLERLTSYTHVFDAYGDQASLNPVNFAHYIARLGDQKFHILARISNAPLDHTNRSNKLAHIIAVDDSQLQKPDSEGPAAESLAIPWVREWRSDETPHVLPDEKHIRLPSPDQLKPENCHRWKMATKDAGWAAVLASTADEPGTTVQVILPREVGRERETWALELVYEALSLLPPESRWEVTYSTFFAGNLPVSIHCQWQFVLDGTDAAKRARLVPRGTVIDIPGIAALGTPAPQNSLTTLTADRSRPRDSDRSDLLSAKRRSTMAATSTEVTGGVGQDGGRGNDVAAVAPSMQSSSVPPDFVPEKVTPHDSRRRFARPSTPLLLRPVSLVIIFLLVSGVAVLLIRESLRGKDSTEFQEIVTSSDRESEKRELSQEKKRKDRVQRDKDAEEERQRRRAEENKQRPELALLEAKDKAEPEAPAVQVPASDQDVKPTGHASPPLQEIRKQKNRLKLKLPESGLNSDPDGPLVLAKIHVVSPEHFELNRIIGGASVLKPGMGFFLERRENSNDSSREWDVIRKSTTGVDLGSKPHVVGTFRLDRNFDLSFRWSRGNDNFEIINCLLEMQADDPVSGQEQEKCTLREVTRIPPVRIALRDTITIEPLLNRNQLPNTQALELFQCEFSKVNANVSRIGPAYLHVGDQVRFRIESKEKGTYPASAEIQATLAENDERVQIELKLRLGLLNGEDKPEIVFAPFTPGLLETTGNELEEKRVEIQKERKRLENERTALETEKKLAPRKSNGEIRDSELKKKIEAWEDTVKTQSQALEQYDARWKAANTLANDLKKLVEDISTNGQLHFGMRLMIPDAGDQGIEVLTTEKSPSR